MGRKPKAATLQMADSFEELEAMKQEKPKIDLDDVIKAATAIEKRQNYKDFDVLLDMRSLALACKDSDDPRAVQTMLRINARIRDEIPKHHAKRSKAAEMYWQSMRDDAYYKFDLFMTYMERKRPEREQFYKPRRRPLYVVAKGIQDLADDNLDELFINLPPRTGKTQIVKFAMVWWGGRNPELSNLYTAFSDKITNSFYTGILELMTDPTYCYAEVFPRNKIVRTKGDDEIIDLNRPKSYPTFTARSLYGTLNGSCDCSGLGVSDDLLSGIEEALSIDRLDTAWGKFDNNFMSRIKFDYGAKLINMGTRWAILDPQGRRQELLENDAAYNGWRYKIISIPALNENDESNFDYSYGVGFSTETYRRRRASFEANNDIASFNAQYQQDPIDRQGAVFTPDTMKFYNGELPVGADGKLLKPDRVYMAVDEAFGGGDFVAAPIAYQYGNMHFIHDVVFDNGDKFVTRPLVAEAILRNKVQACQFEETATTADYHEWIDDYLRERNYQCNITTKAPSTQTSKKFRIFDKAPEIREYYFRDTGCRSPMYTQFISNLYAFKMEGKVKHDDAPDSMAQLCEMKMQGAFRAEVYDSPI